MFKLPGTLAFRLTLWYAGIFTMSALVAFSALYLVISSVIQDHRDEDLLEDMEEFSTLLATQGLDAVKSEMAWEASSDGAENIFLRLLSINSLVVMPLTTPKMSKAMVPCVRFLVTCIFQRHIHQATF